MQWNTNNVTIKTEVIQVTKMNKIPGKGPGNEIVQIHASDGRIFSNFISRWNACNIDIETLNEGDELEIQYCERTVGTMKYNNFLMVRTLPVQPDGFDPLNCGELPF